MMLKKIAIKLLLLALLCGCSDNSENALENPEKTPDAFEDNAGNSGDSNNQEGNVDNPDDYTPPPQDGQNNPQDKRCGEQGKCPDGMVCINSEGNAQCGCEKPEMVSCPGEQNCSIDIAKDVLNCGGCGLACEAEPGADIRCEGRQCVCYEGDAIVDLKTGLSVDNQIKHCGKCGYVCRSNHPDSKLACENGHCADLSCGVGSDGKRMMRCEGSDRCIDLMADQDNCGQCGNQCGKGSCVKGQCLCEDGQVSCGLGNEKSPICVPEDDKRCGAACIDCEKSGMVCEDGQCQCPKSQQMCGPNNTCVAESDTACGAGCKNCASMGLACVSGSCVCRNDELKVTVVQNRIEDLELRSAVYEGETPAIKESGYYTTSATNALPYHLFEINTGNLGGSTDISYEGTTKDSERLALFAYDYQSSKWHKVASGIYEKGKNIQLTATIANNQYAKDGKIRVIAAPELASNGSDTIIFTGDTQNYTTPSYWTGGKPNEIYKIIMEWSREQYLAGKAAYFQHAGDIAENSAGESYLDAEWTIASDAHRLIDEVGMPNGISVGNHDNYMNNSGLSTRPYYDKYFPASRYSDYFWYGGNLDNNYNSYELVTVAGRDFIFLNIGFGAYPYEWANMVLKKYQHRIAVIGLHNYYSVKANSRTTEGNRIYTMNIVPNNNVLIVLSGHIALRYHQVSTFDNQPGRKLYEIVVDHSNLYAAKSGGKGAEGYLRLISFRDGKIINKTYSPYRNDWRTADIEPEEDWSEDLILPDSQREIHTSGFSARPSCRQCANDGMCGIGEVCKEGSCQCAAGKNACGVSGECVSDSDEVCGQACLNCSAKGGVCRDGLCACPEGTNPNYQSDGSFAGCSDLRCERECGTGAVCIQGTVPLCKCGGSSGQICEKGSSCNADNTCSCDEDKIYWDSSSKLEKIGCFEPSSLPGKVPSQISLSIAANAAYDKSAMNVNWVTSPDTSNSELIYSVHSDMSNAKTISAAVYKPESSNIMPETGQADFMPIYSYHAVAADLEPGRTYYYKVGNSKDGYTDIHSFKALQPASSKAPFSFIAVADAQNSYDDQYHAIHNLYSYIGRNEKDASFIVQTGDFVNNGNKSSHWQYYFGNGQNLLYRMPIMAAVGNHDGGTKYDVYHVNFKSRFNYNSLRVSDNWPSPVTTGTIYHFEYGDALFMVLNSMAKNNDLRAQWNKIKELSDSSSKKWRIVIVHIPPYDPGYYYNIDNVHGEMLSQANIDLVLSGHEHSYFRTTLDTTGSADNTTAYVTKHSPESGAGTTYVIGGTTNGYYRGYYAEDKDTSFNQVYYQPTSKAVIQPGIYARVSVSSEEIKYTVYELDKVIDEFTLKKSRREYKSGN